MPTSYPAVTGFACLETVTLPHAVFDAVTTRDDRPTAIPTCALQHPPDEANEAQMLCLLGAGG